MTIERLRSRGQHIRLFIGTKESFYIRKAGFYLGFIIWGRSPEWPKATSLLEGSAPPGDFLKWICTEMQSGAFWDTILRNGTVCALTSSRLDDFFPYSYLYTVLMTIFFEGKLGILGGSLYPSNTLDRTLKRVQFPQGCLGKPTWPTFHCFGHRYGRRDVIWKRSITRQYSLWNIRKYLRMTISQLCIKQICLPSIISNVTSNTTNFVEFGWRVDNVWIVLALCFGLVTALARKSTSLKTSWPMPHPKQIFRKSRE